MDPDPLGRRLVFLGKQLKESFETMLAEHDCTLSTWAVLRSVARQEDPSQVVLAAQIGIEGPTLTRHLDRMCAEGLVARQRDAHDRRIIRISLTEAGRRRWAELHTLADAHETEITRLLTDRQMQHLDAAIRAITTALEDAHVHA